MATRAKNPVKRTEVKPTKVKLRRSPGRPSGIGGGMLDRKNIVAMALQLTKSVPLTELSIVRLASELGVTPALIHYYLGGRSGLGSRDALTTGMMNAFYREMVEQWPAETEDWQQSLEIVAYAVYRAYLRYPGITMYVASHNRYLVVQDVEEGETDYGIVQFEKFVSAVRRAGFSAELTGTYAHLLAMFITSAAHATVAHRWPGQHSQFLIGKMETLDPATFPGTHYVLNGFAHLNAAEAFATGLRMWLQSLELARKQIR